MEPTLFGQILLNFQLIHETDLDRCLDLQRVGGYRQPLGEILVEEGLIDQKILSRILSVQRRELESGGGGPGMSKQQMSDRLKDGRVQSFLQLAVDLQGSDLYLTTGKHPMLRRHGVLTDLPHPILEDQLCEKLIFSLLTPNQREEYRASKRLDFCATVADVGRFRINVFRHREGLGAVIRVIASEPRSFSELGLPSVVNDFLYHRNGLVLVTGSTGSGKTTTLGAMVNEINQHQSRHVVTLEDPIETIISSEKSLVTQREVGKHTHTFADGLRAALREDPDVIVVGELRDAETFSVALTAAETGHLVFGTLHTRSAHGTIVRLIDQFPASQRAHVRTMLAGTLRGVICQELIPNASGGGRSLATEVMVGNPAISNLIRENRAWQIPNVMQTNAGQGMRMLDDDLERLVRHETITVEEAVHRAHDMSRFLVPA